MSFFKKYKKISLISFFIVYSHISLLADIPESLYGIWEGNDRYVFFENVNEEDRIVIILKDYYGWYLDRVVEPEDYSESFIRERNNATTKKSVFVVADSNPLWLSEGNSTEFSGAYEMKLTYAKSDVSYVPFVIIGEKMYLEFWISDALNPEFWKGNVVSEGIKVSNQIEQENLWSWYINETENELYKIRYWKTNMDYDSDLQAELESKHLIAKHIFSAQNTYTCVPGRRVSIRNIDKMPVSVPFDGKDVLYNEEKTLCAVNNVYLKRLIDKETFEELMEIVKIQNSRRKPAPPPLFPPEELDFHWDLIDYLEKDNLIIQKVRQRQKDFGPRGKDLGR